MSELLSRRNVTVTLAATAAAAVAFALHSNGPGHEPSHNNRSVAVEGPAPASGSLGALAPSAAPESSAPAAVAPSSEITSVAVPSIAPSRANTGPTGKPENPLVFVLGSKAGGAALFGCERRGNTLTTFGTDYIEGAVIGQQRITAGNPSVQKLPHTSAYQLQLHANTHEAYLVTGRQTVGSVTVDCGHPFDPNHTAMFDQTGQPAVPADLQHNQPIATHKGDKAVTVLRTHA